MDPDFELPLLIEGGQGFPLPQGLAGMNPRDPETKGFPLRRESGFLARFQIGRRNEFFHVPAHFPQKARWVRRSPGPVRSWTPGDPRVRREIPAAVSAAVLTQTLWPQALIIMAGLLGVRSSRSKRVGSLFSSQKCSFHPRPMIHSPGG